MNKGEQNLWLLLLLVVLAFAAWGEDHSGGFSNPEDPYYQESPPCWRFCE